MYESGREVLRKGSRQGKQESDFAKKSQLPALESLRKDGVLSGPSLMRESVIPASWWGDLAGLGGELGRFVLKYIPAARDRRIGHSVVGLAVRAALWGRWSEDDAA